MTQGVQRLGAADLQEDLCDAWVPLVQGPHGERMVLPLGNGLLDEGGPEVAVCVGNVHLFDRPHLLIVKAVSPPTIVVAPRPPSRPPAAEAASRRRACYAPC